MKNSRAASGGTGFCPPPLFHLVSAVSGASDGVHGSLCGSLRATYAVVQYGPTDHDRWIVGLSAR